MSKVTSCTKDTQRSPVYRSTGIAVIDLVALLQLCEKFEHDSDELISYIDEFDSKTGKTIPVKIVF